MKAWVHDGFHGRFFLRVRDERISERTARRLARIVCPVRGCTCGEGGRYLGLAEGEGELPAEGSTVGRYRSQ